MTGPGKAARRGGTPGVPLLKRGLGGGPQTDRMSVESQSRQVIEKKGRQTGIFVRQSRQNIEK
jgi:hypothetical protein